MKPILKFYWPTARSLKPRWPMPKYRIVATSLVVVGSVCTFVGRAVASEGNRFLRVLEFGGIGLVLGALWITFRMKEKPSHH